MKKYIFDFLRMIFFSLIILFFLMIPELVFSFINPHLAVCGDMDKLGVIFLLALILSMIKSKRIIYTFLAVFGIMQIVQFCNMAYFGVYLTPFAIDFIFLETGDIVNETKDVWYEYIYVVFLVGIPYAFLAGIYARDYFNRVVIKHSAWLLAAFFGFFFYRASTPDGIFQMLFKNTCYASYNTINSFSAFLGNVLPKKIIEHGEEEKFADYIVENVMEDKEKPVNIIFVVGESINVNHMELFGYHRPTSPKMKVYAQADPFFVYKKAWAAGVNTLISLPMLYNIQVNPKNYRKLIVRDSYLMKMAKDNNFKVTYIEAQNASLFKKTSISHYDEAFIYHSKDGEKLKGESGFLDQSFDKIDLKGRNFIIVHKRNVHSPYDDNYMYEPETYDVYNDPALDDRVEEYDKAMVYEDMLLKKILDFAASAGQETYFFYTSDHGEATGQNGIWGHGHLDKSDLEVPFMFTMFNAQDENFLNKIKEMDHPCAHDISLLVAEKLGYRVEIPDEDLNVCQVNGRDTMGRAGILKIIKSPEGIKFEKEL